MGLIDIFKPLSKFLLSSAVNKSQWYKKIVEKIFWDCQKSNQGLLGEKQECYLCVMQPPSWFDLDPGPFVSNIGKPAYSHILKHLVPSQVLFLCRRPLRRHPVRLQQEVLRQPAAVDERVRADRELSVAARHQRAEAQLQPDGPPWAGQQAETRRDCPGVHPGELLYPNKS